MTGPVAPELRERALQVVTAQRVAVMVVAYEAERHIEAVLARIPSWLAPLLAEIFVLDDASGDGTVARAVAAGERLGLTNLRVLRTPSNRGYGGNQKVGYSYAISRGFDLVVMLHGDGQYPPEHLPALLAAFAAPGVDCVLGSRMLRRADALRGGMPLYKWLGNQLLTGFENRVMGVRLAEFHTGYRAYRLSTLARIPFRYGSDGFHFDTEILIQLLSAGCRLVEVPIPTHYGDEVCRVDGLRYAWDCARDVIHYRLFRMGLFYNPLLDFDLFEGDRYHLKREPNSLHQHVLGQAVGAGESLLELGAGAGYRSAALARRAARVVAVDRELPAHAGGAEARRLDLDSAFDEVLGKSSFDRVVALDLIEHLERPEAAVERIARVLRPGGQVLASTANIGFFPMRILHLAGLFNYGKRGILDLGHRRLFTVASFAHLFRTYGFEVESVRGFGPPILDLISRRWPFALADALLSWLARLRPSLFAYNFLLTARRRPLLEEVVAATLASATEPAAARAAAANAVAGAGR